MNNFNKLRKIYLVAIVALLLLAIYVSYVARTLFSAWQGTIHVEEQSRETITVNTGKIDQAYDLIFNGQPERLDLRE